MGAVGRGGLLSLLQDGQQGIVVLRMGNWAAPYGIILVADVLSMTMVVLTMTVAVAVVAFSLRTVEQAHQEYFLLPALLYSHHGRERRLSHWRLISTCLSFSRFC